MTIQHMITQLSHNLSMLYDNEHAQYMAYSFDMYLNEGKVPSYSQVVDMFATYVTRIKGDSPNLDNKVSHYFKHLLIATFADI